MTPSQLPPMPSEMEAARAPWLTHLSKASALSVGYDSQVCCATIASNGKGTVRHEAYLSTWCFYRGRSCHLILTGVALAAVSYAEEAKGRCVGANACKGQSACATASNGCMGQNFLTMTKDECDKIEGATFRAISSVAAAISVAFLSPPQAQLVARAPTEADAPLSILR